MTWRPLSVTWEREAKRDIKGLPAKDVQQICAAVDRFAATGQGDVRSLQGQSGQRLRVRDRRVFLSIVRAQGQLFVLRVIKRGDAY